MTEETKKHINLVKGSYAVDAPNKKLEINPNPNETHGVLFEDISSISVKNLSSTESEEKHHMTTVSWMGFSMTFVGVFVFLGGFFTNESWFELFITGAIVGLVGFLIWSMNIKTDKIETKFDYDQVTIETRGGSHLSYFVDAGQGKKDVSAIETARRS